MDRRRPWRARTAAIRGPAGGRGGRGQGRAVTGSRVGRAPLRPLQAPQLGEGVLLQRERPELHAAPHLLDPSTVAPSPSGTATNWRTVPLPELMPSGQGWRCGAGERAYR
ncbi:hypothetical protein [Streptomyces olivaceoviridis]